jgi:membrane protein YdbS with pleckstrin-like domain
MKDFDHLMSVWQGQPKRDQLSVDEVLKSVKKDIRGIAGRLYWGIVAIAALIACCFMVMFFLVFNSWTTYVGLLIILVTMLMYISLIVRNYRILNKQDVTINPAEYLNGLKAYQKSRSKLVGWFYYIFILLISAGLGLYFAEILEKSTLTTKIIIYGTIGIWFIFITLYLRPRIFKYEDEKLSLMIERLERLGHQFE